MTENTPAAIERVATIEPGTAARLAREHTVWLFTRPWLLVPVIMLLVLVSLAATLSWIADGEADLVIPSILVFAVGGAVAGTYFSSKRSIVLAYPDGFVARASLSDDALASGTAIGSGTIVLRAIRSVHTTESGVLLVMRGSLAVGILPRALLTEDEIEHLRLSVAAARRAK